MIMIIIIIIIIIAKNTYNTTQSEEKLNSIWQVRQGCSTALTVALFLKYGNNIKSSKQLTDIISTRSSVCTLCLKKTSPTF